MGFFYTLNCAGKSVIFEDKVSTSLWSLYYYLLLFMIKIIVKYHRFSCTIWNIENKSLIDPFINVKGLTNRLIYSIWPIGSESSQISTFAIFMYFSCISDRNLLKSVHLALFLLKLLQNYPLQCIDHFSHLRIHFLCISVPKDQQLITSAHINNSPIEGITPIEHALVLQ